MLLSEFRQQGAVPLPHSSRAKTARGLGNFWRMGVPVATPINSGDVLAGLASIFEGHTLISEFEREIAEVLDVDYVRAVNSGRSALFLTLAAMKKSSTRNEVIIPAFVCPSVGRAVIKAGLQPVLCDVGADGSGLCLTSLQELLSERTLCVCTAHLYGYPTDVSATVDMAHRSGAMVIEDGAQAFGARVNGKAAGTTADAGVFSFGMSKVLWSIGGGAVTTSRSELRHELDRMLVPLLETTLARSILSTVKAALIALTIRSHYLGPVSSVWSSTMRGRDDCDDFDVLRLPSSNAALGRSVLKRFAEITRVRRSNALFFSAELGRYSQLTMPDLQSHGDSVCLRFPIIARDSQVRASLVTELRARGINVSQMYENDSYEALRNLSSSKRHYPQTEYLVERIMNLPTHLFVTARDRAAIVDAFRSVLEHQSDSAG